MALSVVLLTAGGLAAQTGVLQGTQPLAPIQQQDEQADFDAGDGDGAQSGAIDAEVDVIVHRGGQSGVAVAHDPNGPDLGCHFSAYTGPITAQDFVDDHLSVSGVEIAGPNLVNGLVYNRLCFAEGGGGVVAEFYPVLKIPGGVTPTLDGALAQAEAQVPPQVHPLELSPTDQQITGVKTWFEAPVTELGPEIAAVAGFSAEVKADLLKVEINTGAQDVNGNDIAFECAVDEFTEWAAGATETQCGHTYWEVPASGAYQMEVVYHWTYSWRSHTATGFTPYAVLVTAPLVFDVEVVDLEAVISR